MKFSNKYFWGGIATILALQFVGVIGSGASIHFPKGSQFAKYNKLD